MICELLRPLEEGLIEAGIHETDRGKVWGNDCREWVYFDCFIDTEAVANRLPLPPRVTVHAHRGAHDGQERGFICSQCRVGVIGAYEPLAGISAYRG